MTNHRVPSEQQASTIHISLPILPLPAPSHTITPHAWWWGGPKPEAAALDPCQGVSRVGRSFWPHCEDMGAPIALAEPDQAASAGEVYSNGKNKLLIMRAAPAGLSGPHGLMNIQHRAEY